jgi:phosphatidylglycerol:prolipoprotein diacylglycerol transferase
MLPYVHVADLNILGFRLHPFGLLVVAAITVGTALARWRARRRGLDLDEVESCIGWMLALGFPSAHILDALLYHPREVLERPWALLFLWEGMGSFSGFIGALAGVVLWRRFEWRPARSFGPWRIGPLAIGPFALSRLVRRNVTLPILPYADLILSVFPVAWIFGRITVIQGHFARYDLGTLELLLTIGIALAFVLLWRRRMVTGAYVVIVSLVYAPARFAMDFLRIEGTPGADPRYGGLTPAQWLCGALFVFGLVLLRRVVLVERRAVAP